MNTRDRRALWVLGTWALGMALWWGGGKAMHLRQEWKSKRQHINPLYRRRMALEMELARVRAERRQRQSAVPKALQGLSEDQLKLRGQDSLLASAEKAGLKGVRLRPEAGDSGARLRQLRWTLEGEGTLPQWVEALQAMENAQPLMGIQALRLELTGDPWTLPEGMGLEGPSIKGAAVCSWQVLSFTE